MARNSSRAANLQGLSALGKDLSAAAGECDRKLVSRVDPELAEDACQVTLDGARRDEQCLGDLAVAAAMAGEFRDTALARCQRLEAAENDSAWARTCRAE